MSSTTNQQNSHDAIEIVRLGPDVAQSYVSLRQLHDDLRKYGCDGCELGLQEGLVAPVLYRGIPEAKLMIVGEAPGLNENEQGMPFCGPAGEVLDKAINAAGIGSFYISNAVRCRPIAAPEEKKQNRKPLQGHIKACRPYLLKEIEIIQPKLVWLLGKTAVDSVLPFLKKTSMTEAAGKPYSSEEFPGIMFFVSMHPAYILHRKKAGQEAFVEAKRKFWNETLAIKDFLNE